MKINVSIVLKENYNKFQKSLIDIWESNDCKDNNIYFTRIFKLDREYQIKGIMLEHLQMSSDGKEIVSMTIQNFMYLMIKSGVELEVNKLD